MHMTQAPACCSIFLACSLLLHYCVLSTATQTISYKYTVNASEADKGSAKLTELDIEVQLTHLKWDKSRNRNSLFFVDRRLTYYNASLGRKSAQSYVQAVSIHNPDGSVRQVHIDDTTRISTTRLNLLKGLISFLTLHAGQSPGVEVDSSGSCSTSYALVDDRSRSSHASEQPILLDRIKENCQEISTPMDNWEYSDIPSPVVDDRRFIQARYHFDSIDGNLIRATGYEGRNLSLFTSSLANRVGFVSWQHLELVRKESEVAWPFKKTVVELAGATNDELIEIVKTSFGRVVHLPLVHTFDQETEACSLNSNLFHSVPGTEEKVDHQTEHDNDPARFLPVIRDLIESSRDYLHPTAFANVKSAHYAVQLIPILRCLPSTAKWVQILGQTTNLLPPYLRNDRFYRQTDTWYDQLTDLLISCGTPTCVEVVIRRLEAFTEHIGPTKEDEFDVNQELAGTRRILMTRLWPSLSHLAMPQDYLTRLFDCCGKIAIRKDKFVCLTTLANLCSKVPAESRHCVSELKESTEALLDISSILNSSDDRAKESHLDHTALITGINLIGSNLGDTFIDNFIRIIETRELPASIRSSAIRVATAIFSQNKNNTASMHSSVSQLPHLYLRWLKQQIAEPIDDLVISHELFVGILQMDIPGHEIAELLRKLAEQKRWASVRACRLLIALWCRTERLSLDECCRFGEGKVDECTSTYRTHHLGLASGWSGLAASRQSLSGQIMLFTGELINIRSEIISDYTLQLNVGPNGELRNSHLRVSLLSTMGEADVFDLTILADGLVDIAGGLGFGGSSGSGQGLWINLGLNYFGTSMSPWTVLSGGLTDAATAIWRAPSEHVPVLQLFKLIMDQRRYMSFSSGLILRLDLLGLVALETSGAMTTSFWHQSGKSSVISKTAVAFEAAAHISGADVWQHSVTAVNGMGGQSQIELSAGVLMNSPADNTCMKMSRGSDSLLHRWKRHQVNSGSPIDPDGPFSCLDLDNEMNPSLFSYSLPGETYKSEYKFSPDCAELLM